MDPDAAWNEMLAALAAGDNVGAMEHAFNLLKWLAKGGFPPRTSSHEGLTREWHDQAAKAVCRLALKHARARCAAEQEDVE